MGTATTAFRPVSRWHPRGLLYQFRNPRRFIQALTHAPVAIGFDPALPPATTAWTFDPPAHDSRVAIRFRSEADVRQLSHRWRLLAGILHERGMADRRVRFRETLIDLGDGCGYDGRPDVFAFARPRGSQAGLIPSPSLLQTPRGLPAPLPWDRKTETVYFRGVSTGASEYASNVRVALCKAAKTIPNADCRISTNVQPDPCFAERLAEDDLLGRSQPVKALNWHKYLIDADGNASSWDRYKLIGLFGGVPIRFESVWEECWHEFLLDGVNCVQADRHSLPAIVEHLRTHPHEAREIAMAARRLVTQHLLPATARDRLASTLSQR